MAPGKIKYIANSLIGKMYLLQNKFKKKGIKIEQIEASRIFGEAITENDIDRWIKKILK